LGEAYCEVLQSLGQDVSRGAVTRKSLAPD